MIRLSTLSSSLHHPPSTIMAAPIDKTEISIQEALRSLLTDKELSDLKLKGTDGVLVPAVRAMVAARSLVFRGMLYGDFAEAKQSVVDVQYSGEVLEAIVEYIYSDTATILDSMNAFFDSKHKFVQTIVALMDAATYFELPNLCRKAREAASAAMEKEPALSGAFLAACDTQRSLAASDLVKSASKNIRANPKLLLEEGAELAQLSADRMEEILKYNTLFADEFTAFLILQAWSNALEEEPHHQQVEDPNPTVSAVDNSDSDSRRKIATQLVEHIALDQISPSDLSTTVATSGLVTNEQLLEAYKAQALTIITEKNLNASPTQENNTYRHVPEWKRSNDVAISAATDGSGYLDQLQGPPLNEGIHKWSIKVEEVGARLELGVRSRSAKISWVYSSHGQAFAFGDPPGGSLVTSNIGNRRPRFDTGSIVTFTLDLTKDGTLSACVDNNSSQTVLLFSGMLSQIGVNETGRFVPAVVLGQPARVRFLGFEQCKIPEPAVYRSGQDAPSSQH
jgi:hypothetical protein